MNFSTSRKEQPRERLQEKGVAYLGDVELVALLIGTGCRGKASAVLAQDILVQIGGVTGLAKQGIGTLSSFSGMGSAKASRLLAAVELGARVIEKQSIKGKGERFSCSNDIFVRYRTRLCRLRQEVFFVVGLNNKNEVVCESVVAMGSVEECPVNPREVFRPLIMEAAARTLVLHNHPSGDATPSPEDMALTQRLVEVGNLVGIPILDHVVIGQDSYYSFRDMGVFAT